MAIIFGTGICQFTNILIANEVRMVSGAVTDGCTEIEIQETLLQTAIYSGMPTGMSRFRAADAVIKKLKEEGKL